MIRNQEAMISELRAELRAALDADGGTAFSGAAEAAPAEGAVGVSTDARVDAAPAEGAAGVSTDARVSALDVSAEDPIEVSVGDPVDEPTPVASSASRPRTVPFRTYSPAARRGGGGTHSDVDWAAAYDDIDRTRADLEAIRARRRPPPSPPSASRGTDWAAAYEDIERARADARAASSNPRAETTDGNGSEAEGANATTETPPPGNEKPGAVTESRDSPEGALVGDLYKKLAALGATRAGELLAQSPTVRRQLSRVRMEDEEGSDAERGSWE